MAEIVIGVDWIAVIVGAVAAYLLGWFWYSPRAFGTKWAEGVGVKMPAPGATPPAMAMIVQFLATLALSWVVGVTAKNNALLTIILVTATLGLVVWANALFVKKSVYATATEVGFIVAMVVVMIAAQAIL